MLDGLCPFVAFPHAGEFAGCLFKVPLFQRDALDAGDHVAAVVRLVDEKEHILRLNVQVRIELLTDIPVEEVVIVEDHDIRVSVRDSGLGIKPEFLEGLFEPFGMLGNSRQGGTGLGLAISKEIILAHHGKIWAESKVGKGSTFHFTLPL